MIGAVFSIVKVLEDVGQQRQVRALAFGIGGTDDLRRVAAQLVPALRQILRRYAGDLRQFGGEVRRAAVDRVVRRGGLQRLAVAQLFQQFVGEAALAHRSGPAHYHRPVAPAQLVASKRDVEAARVVDPVAAVADRHQGAGGDAGLDVGPAVGGGLQLAAAFGREPRVEVACG